MILFCFSIKATNKKTNFFENEVNKKKKNRTVKNAAIEESGKKRYLKRKKKNTKIHLLHRSEYWKHIGWL